MAKSVPQSLSLVSPDGCLRVEFQWQQDRFWQKLFLNDTKVGSSIEGDAEDPWPPSPPLQQLSHQRIDGREVILGVGGAGSGHWSISVKLDPESDQGSSIHFDLACRCRDRPTFLGSTYRLTDSIIALPLPPSAACEIGEGSESGRTIIRAAATAPGTHQWSFQLKKKGP